jgi:integrase/recombinase XerD
VTNAVTIVQKQFSEISRAQPTRADQNPVLVYLGSLAKGSRRTMMAALETVSGLLSNEQVSARDFPWWKIQYQHMELVQSTLRDTKAPATVNKIMTAVKQVLLRCRRLKLMTSEQFSEATDIKRVKAWSELRGRFIEEHEVIRMLETCEATRPIDVRDKAILMLLATGGLRREEAANVRMEDFNPSAGSIYVVKGKGGKPRSVTASPSLVSVLNDWIRVRGDSPGMLFCPVYKGGNISPGRGISHQSVYSIVDKVAARANLSQDISPHDFRRTFISMLLDNNDIKTVSKLVGHEHIETTGKYDRRGERAMRKATDSLPTFGTKR